MRSASVDLESQDEAGTLDTFSNSGGAIMAIYVKEIPGFATKHAAEAEAAIWALQGLTTETERGPAGEDQTFTLVVYFPTLPDGRMRYDRGHVPQCPLLRRIARHETRFDWDYCEPQVLAAPASQCNINQIVWRISSLEDEESRKSIRVGGFALRMADIKWAMDVYPHTLSTQFSQETQTRIALLRLCSLWKDSDHDPTRFASVLGCIWPHIVPGKTSHGDGSHDRGDATEPDALQQAISTFIASEPVADDC